MVSPKIAQVLVPPGHVTANDAETMSTLKSMNVQSSDVETLVRIISSERVHIWQMEANSSFVGVDFLGFPTMRLTTQGLLELSSLHCR